MSKTKTNDPQAKDQAKTNPAETPAPNIQFVGRNKNEEIDPSLALTKIVDGMREIKLPEPEDQLEAFYHEDAKLIRKRYPTLYKLPVELGK